MEERVKTNDASLYLAGIRKLVAEQAGYADVLADNSFIN